MTWEIARLSDYLTSTLVSVLPSLLTATGAILIMARIDPMLALVVPVLVPVFFVLGKLLGRRLRSLSAVVQEAEAAAMASAQQTLEILPAIKTFTREPETASGYRALLERARRAALAEVTAHAALSPVTGLVTASAALILLGLAGEALAAGALTASGAISFMLYAALLTRPVAALSHVWGRTQAARGVLTRMSRVLGEKVETGGDRPLARARGAIAVEGLHFAYPGRPPVLSGIDLAIAAGECVALTGVNGAGKTTLTALMMGLMAPGQGRILLDGQDVATLRLRDLRRQFGHVPQRPLLFNGTIRDNIAFGLPGATGEHVEAAARAAQADAFIRELPAGYDTLIGDAGARLSGGQSQRVALARALIKDPPVLILDEATSMYDLEGESAFVAAAATALRGRTVILIAHRPATLALARRILVLDDGRLVQKAAA
jgi:ABC-type multidrug transport system fused ATPase/permease subunit